MDRQSFTAFFKDKTVTLMGLGLLGRGVGDAAFLAAHCKKVYVTDTKSADELRVSVEALKNYNNIEFILGGHDTKIFEDVDFVIKGAGVRLDNPYILHARKNNVPVYMSTALFASLSSIKTIGITGTRGKTTVTCMIADILKRAGKKVLMGGNLRGISTLALLSEADQFDYAVLELDSWQLQGFDDLGISPNIGVFTTFYPDHMNYYDGDMARYLCDKTAVFRYQKKGDALITTPEITELTEHEHEDYPAHWVVAKPLPPSFQMKVPGEHNLLNAGLAKAVGAVCGIDDKIVENALHQFDAVEGRLQFVGEWEGRRFYNDSNATTQDATMAALKAFPSSSIILIFGGADKGLPIDLLLGHISSAPIRCVLIKGTGSDRVLQEKPDIPVVGSMQEAVKKAVETSNAGDNIILSPAFASFGVFKNEYDRSDQFMTEVKNLIAGTKGCSCQH
jgi:UDP-N-acetylmuramoylalanine--D-glutamate ligase